MRDPRSKGRGAMGKVSCERSRGRTDRKRGARKARKLGATGRSWICCRFGEEEPFMLRAAWILMFEAPWVLLHLRTVPFSRPWFFCKGVRQRVDQGATCVWPRCEIFTVDKCLEHFYGDKTRKVPHGFRTQIVMTIVISIVAHSRAIPDTCSCVSD